MLLILNAVRAEVDIRHISILRQTSHPLGSSVVVWKYGVCPVVGVLLILNAVRAEVDIRHIAILRQTFHPLVTHKGVLS